MRIVEADLPMDLASRMQRAKELGFTIQAYHGTGATFKAFDLNKGNAGTINGPAPHFTDSKPEATGYAKDRAAPKRGKVLSVLLRVTRPFIIDSFTLPRRYIPQDEYQRLVGHRFANKWDTEPRTGQTYTDMQNALHAVPGMEYSREDGSNRRRWGEIYRRLMHEGYDAVLWPDTPADHSDHPYGKYIMFEPKNVRLIKAAFDPAKADSADLLA